jgi:hypothetical protein
MNNYFDSILDNANFPTLFLSTAKMEGDFLCSIIGNTFYYINTISQEYGEVQSWFKPYVLSGYAFSSDGHPYIHGTKRRIVGKRKFDIIDGVLISDSLT